MPKHIKICYILPEYNEKTTDHFYHHYEFLEELSKRMDIFFIAEKGNEGGLTSFMKRFYIQRFRFLPLRFLESFLAILWARILGYNKFYTHYCYIGGINAAIISRLCRGQSYYWHCEMIWEFKQKLFSKIGLRLCLKLSHFLVTGSDGLKQEYAKYYRLKLDNIKVMPNWINLERFSRSRLTRIVTQKDAEKIILFVHWLAERKGAHFIVPIVKQLIHDSSFIIHNSRFIIIGDGPLKEKILREIKENKLEKFVQVLGKIPHKEVINYYAMADIFILPSLQEGFPRVLLEAMASGVPYVAFDVGAVREIFPQIAQGFIVERGNVEEFAEKIQILLSDNEIYDRFKKEGLEKIKEYSLEKVIDKFINLF